MRIVRVMVLAAAAVASTATSQVPVTPEPELCSAPDVAYEVTGIEIGKPYEQDFVGLADGATAPMEWGSQGGQMLVVQLRLTGPNLGTCMYQRTTVRRVDGGEVVGEVSAPIVFEREDASHVRSNELYVVLDQGVAAGEPLVVEVTAYGRTQQLGVVAP